MAASNASATSSGSGSVAWAVGEEEEVVSGCSWKVTTAQDGVCYLEPRTCNECLNETPTNGEYCALTTNGVCLSLEDYEATQNDEDSGDRGVTFFVAGDAPYCETNSSSASSDGCVSIDSCASSTWWSEARERLPLIMRIVNESTPDCSFATDSVNADTSASDLDATAEATSTSSTTGNKNPLASDDKCTWYEGATECSTPRSCQACLNVALASGEACTITPEGFCASAATHYDYNLDFRVGTNSSTDGYYFPSTNTTYCAASDPACTTECSSPSSPSSNSASFCTGSDGCVCIAFCESAEWQETVVSELCDASTSSSTPGIYGISFPWQNICVIVGVVIVLVLAVLLGVWRVQQVHSARRRDTLRVERLRSRLSAPPLELPAWKAMREELIAHGNGEHSVVGDRDRLTPLHAYNMPARQYGDRVSSEAVISIEARENDPVAARAASWRVWNRLP